MTVWISGFIDSVDFLRTFHCPTHGQAWSEDVDPFVVQYFSDHQVCTSIRREGSDPAVYYVHPDANHTADKESSGEYFTDYIYFFIPVEQTPDWLGRHVWYDPEIPFWERCLFLERNYHIYGNTNYKQAEWEPGRSGEGMYSHLLPFYESRLGNAGQTLYCPNFDPGHPYYLIESVGRDESE